MHIHSTYDAGAALAQRGIDGPVVMLNLLRFRDVADYSATPELEPDSPISGADAYDRYIEAVMPLLDNAGAEVIYKGRGGPVFIGPRDERWDLVALVRHRSVSAFFAFAKDPDYAAIAGHRTAALEDSRLLPMV